MQNVNIQIQNLKTLSYLDYNCDLTSTQIVLIVIGILIVTGLIAWGIKKFIENI